MQIANRYGNRCAKCGVQVQVGAGVAHKPDGGRWQTYCAEHAPERISVKPVVTERKLDRDGWITMPYEAENLGLVKSMPTPAGQRSGWDPQRKQWRVSLADADRMRVLAIADKLGLNVAPELRQVTDVDAPSLPDSLYPFQKTGVNWLSRRDRAILGDDMGVGKTCQALHSITSEERVLIVCPASLKYNWERECRQWRPDLRPRVVNASDGRLVLPRPGDVVIINYDILPKWLLKDRNEMPDGVSKLDGITLIADEAHFLGNYKSQRSKKVTALSKLFAKRVLFLTGTPLTRDPSTLWSVLGAAGVQREAFGSWTNFTKVFGGRKNRWGGMEWGSPAPIVPELLRRVMLRRMRSEVLPQLPPKRYTDLIVNGLSATLRSTLDTIWGDQGDLLTVTQDLPGFEEFSKVRAELAAAKIPALLEMVQEHEDQDVPLVVCSDHRAPVEALENRPGWGVIKGGMDLEKRDAVVEAFQTGNLKGVAFTITAGGVGITLTRAWKMLMVDLNWTPANVLQAEDRLVRIGQHAGSVEITRLVIDHPLEQHIHGIVAKKIALAQASLDDSINAKKLPAPQAPVNGAVRNETQDEYDIRMEAIRQADALAEQKAQEEAEATLVQRCKNRVSVILEREQAKNPGYVQNKKYLTPTRVASIRTGIAYMSSICDGAISRDNQGFNKSDTGLGKILATTGLMTVEELRCSELILLRYPRQVSLSD